MSNAPNQPAFDAQTAHRWFAADCFNRTWELIEKPGRTPADTAEMIHRCHASRWHWGQRTDAKPRNLAVAAWQLARVYALARRLDEARCYANECLTLVEQHNVGPFDLAFAHEAIARIAGFAGDSKLRDAHLAQARDAAASVTDAEDLKWLNANLDPLARGEHDWPLAVAVK